MPDELEHGRDCYDRGAWSDAYEALRIVDQGAPLGPEDLERLGIAAYVIGRELDAITHAPSG